MNILFTTHVAVYTVLVTNIAQIHIESRLSVLDLFLSSLHYLEVVLILGQYSDIESFLDNVPNYTGL